MALCEFEDSLVYRVSFRTPRATQRNLVLKNNAIKSNLCCPSTFGYGVLEPGKAIRGHILKENVLYQQLWLPIAPY